MAKNIESRILGLKRAKDTKELTNHFVRAAIHGELSEVDEDDSIGDDELNDPAEAGRTTKIEDELAKCDHTSGIPRLRRR